MPDPNEISLNDASALTARYRQLNGTTYIGGTIPKAAILDLLSQTGAAYLKVYFGNDEEDSDKPHLVFVATTDDNGEPGDDILEKIKNRGSTCPPYSGTANDLNS